MRMGRLVLRRSTLGGFMLLSACAGRRESPPPLAEGVVNAPTLAASSSSFPDSTSPTAPLPAAPSPPDFLACKTDQECASPFQRRNAGQAECFDQKCVLVPIAEIKCDAYGPRHRCPAEYALVRSTGGPTFLPTALDDA